MHKTVAILLTLIVGAFTTPAAHAQWAVVDVGAIAQLVQQVAKMEEQLTTMQAHLRQAEQEYQSITGDRGMENLLSGTVRNYLPADWQSLQAAITQTEQRLPGARGGDPELNHQKRGADAAATGAPVAGGAGSDCSRTSIGRHAAGHHRASTRHNQWSIRHHPAIDRGDSAALATRRRFWTCRPVSPPSRECSPMTRASSRWCIRPRRPSSGPCNSAVASRQLATLDRSATSHAWVCSRAERQLHNRVSARCAG